MRHYLGQHHLSRTTAFRLRSPTRVLLVIAGFLLAGTALPAQAQELGKLRQITGPSPFADCTSDDVAGQPGINYPETEIEPWIDANPTDPRNLIALARS